METTILLTYLYIKIAWWRIVLSINTPLKEHQNNVLEGAVPSDYTHDVTVTCDASSDFQPYYMQTIYCQLQTTSHQTYTACPLTSIYMLSEMTHQYDLLALDLCINPNQTKHTTFYSKQLHHTQRQYIYLTGPASSSDLTNSLWLHIHSRRTTCS